METLWSARFPRFTVEVDGEVVTHHATSAVIGNMRTYGGPFCLTPRATPDDGVLDICVFRARHSLGFAAYWSGATLGLHTLLPGVSTHRGSRIVLGDATGVPVHLDGDPAGSLPMTFELEPGAVRIIAPPRR